MADISSVTLLDGSTYNFKDKAARDNTPLVIIQQPQNALVGVGDDVTFSVVVKGGSGTYTYQWQMMMPGMNWYNMSNASSSSWTIKSNSSSMTMLYRCVISDGSATVTSDPVFIYFTGTQNDNLKYAVQEGNYGVCSTAAGTAMKVVSIPGLQVRTGVTVHIKFEYENTATNPSLQINGSTGYPIYNYGTTRASTDSETTGWNAGSIVCLTFNGTGWVRNQGFNTNEKYDSMTSSEATTGTASDARLVSASVLKEAIEKHAPNSVKLSITIGDTWEGSGPYTQAVTISGYTVTSNTLVDLTCDDTLLSQLAQDGVERLYISNSNASLTAVAIGAAPSAEMTVVAVLSEVD